MLWPYPSKTESDLEYWSLFNTLYLTRKIINPIKKAERNSNTEEYFSKQKIVFKNSKNEEIKSTVMLSAVGDLLPNSYIHSAKDIYKEVSDFIFNSDFKVANFEMNYDPNLPFSGSFGDIRFNAIEETFNVLMQDELKRKYDLVFTANNMCFRYGEEGIVKTLNNLDKKGILHVGTSRSNDEDQIRIVNINGIKFAFLSYTYGTNGVKLEDDKTFLVNKVRLNALNEEDQDLTMVFSNINEAKKRNVDFIIASLHWGKEYEYFPTRKQIKLAHKLCDNGVDVILGHHAHVVQPFEKYVNKIDRECFCSYSLGSITDYYTFHKSNFLVALRLTFEKGINAVGVKNTHISCCEVLPMWIKINKHNKMDTVRLIPIYGENERKNDQSILPKDLHYIKKVKKRLKLISLDNEHHNMAIRGRSD